MTQITIAKNYVPLRGEGLSQIAWRSRQWAVTFFGIECPDGTYPIHRDRLLEDLPTYSWPEHMAEKGWVDIDEFITAWLVALAIHGYGAPIPDTNALAAIIRRAKKIHARVAHILPNFQLTRAMPAAGCVGIGGLEALLLEWLEIQHQGSGDREFATPRDEPPELRRRRGDMLDKRREMMAKWAEFCEPKGGMAELTSAIVTSKKLRIS